VPAVSPASAYLADPHEVTFYSDQRGNRITNTRAIFGARTFAMANISSVTTGSIAPDTGPAKTTIGFGAALTLIGVFVTVGSVDTGVGLTVISIGMGILALGMYAYRGLRFRYTLRISSSSGETNAIESPDFKYVYDLAQALNEAIVKRG
jgi:hypothetical protein